MTQNASSDESAALVETESLESWYARLPNGWVAAGHYDALMSDADGGEGIVRARFAQARAPGPSLLQDLGVPAGLPVVWIDEDFSQWPKHRKLHVASWGVIVSHDWDLGGYKVRTYTRDDSCQLTVGICLQRVEVESFEPYGEIRWRIGGADVSLMRMNLKRPLQVLEPVRKALRVVAGLQSATTGRSTGDGATWEGGVPHFLEDLWQTLEEKQRATGTRYGIDITQRAFLGAMKGSPSRPTLYKWLKEAKLRAQDIKSGRVSRSNYEEFVRQKSP